MNIHVESCQKMGPTLIYIIGLFGFLSGTVSAFLLPLDTATTITPEEWGQWNVVQVAPVCILIRSRNCTSEGCRKEEYKFCKDIAHWSDWGQLQCKTLGRTCFIARTRNCSIQALKNCASNETNQDITVWGDMNTCPCRKGETVSAGHGPGHWKEWGEWRCQIYADHCYIYRTRQCSIQDLVNCPPNESSQVKLWTDLDQCPCRNGTASSVTTNTTSVAQMIWTHWGSSECHREQIPCVVYRYRNCSNNVEDECLKHGGRGYELGPCDNKCSDLGNAVSVTINKTPVAQVTWNQWGSWECHREQHPCIVYRYRNCSNNVEDDCLKQGGRGYILGPCDDRCNGESHWLEWSAWKCNVAPYGSICEMKRKRNCSVDDECRVMSDILTKCSDKICPEQDHWLEWSAWECTLAPNRTCKMSRNRNCSSISLDDCVGVSAETTHCSHTVCQELIQTSANVNCTGFDTANSVCENRDGCSDFTNVLSLICGERNTAAQCPVTCGCCAVVKSNTTMPTKQTGITTNSTPTTSVNYYTAIMNRMSTNSKAAYSITGNTGMTKSTNNAVTSTSPGPGVYGNNSPTYNPTTDTTDTVTVVSGSKSMTAVTTHSPPVKVSSISSSHGASSVSNDLFTATSQTKTTVLYVNTNVAHKTSIVDGRDSSTNSQLFQHTTGVEAKYSADMKGSTIPTKTFTTNIWTATITPVGTTIHTKPYTITPLPEWSHWFYDACSVTCGNGTAMRLRHCSSGKDSDCGNGKAIETVDCSDGPCPVDGAWSNWQGWSKCSTSCAAGSRSRVRTCSNPPPAQGGTNCIGDSFMTEKCDYGRCPEWSNWFYDACSVTCGTGTTMRLRHCSSGKDSDCGTGKAIETVKCTEKPCTSF